MVNDKLADGVLWANRREQLPEKSEDLALEGVEIPEAPMDRVEHDFVVNAPVFMDQEVAKSFHAFEDAGRGGREHALP